MKTENKNLFYISLAIIFSFIILFLTINATSYTPTHYVNISHPSCSDAYTRTQASNPSTPYCGNDSRFLNNAQSGDILIAACGQYTNTTGWFPTTSYAGRVILQGQNRNCVNFSMWYPSFRTVNSCWTNYQNNSGFGLWNMTNSSCVPGGSTDDLVAHQISTGKPYYPYIAMNNITDNTTASRYEGCWGDNSSRFTCKFNISFNPKNGDLGIGRAANGYGVFEPTNADNFQIDNIHIQASEYALFVQSGSDNFILSNSSTAGCLSDTGCIRYNAGGGDNAIITDNNFSKMFLPDWAWTAMKFGVRTETSALFFEEAGTNHIIRRNFISGFANGIVILAYSGDPCSMNGTTIYDNILTFLMDDGLEFETHTCGYNVYRNNISNVFSPVSMSPADSSSQKSYMNHILITKNLQMREVSSGGVNGSQASFKFDGTPAVDNWEIEHITSCDGQSGSTAVINGNGNFGSAQDLLFKNSLIGCSQVPSGPRLIDYTGSENDNVRYVNNNYWKSAGTNYGRHINDSGASTERTYAQMISDAPAMFINSTNYDPQINIDGIPTNNSNLMCTGGEAGTYLGALACNTTAEVANYTLYVNSTHASCSDSNTRTQASNFSTPWCLPSTTNADKMLDNDSLFIANGNYNSRFSFASKNMSIKINGQSRDGVIITNIDTDFNKTNNGVWINATSSPSVNMWKTTNANVGEFANIYFPNGTGFFNYDNLSKFNSSNNQYVYSMYSDDANNIIYVRSTLASFNPNTTSLMVMGSDYDVFSFDTVTGNVIVSNLTIKFSKWAIYVENTSNIIFDNISVQFATRGIRGKDSLNTNITLKNSYLNSYFDSNWYWQDLHLPTEVYSETKAIANANVHGSIRIYNNTFSNWSNGLTLTHASSRYSQSNNLISENYFDNIYDDAIEIENLVSNWTIRKNFGRNVYVSIALAPSDCTGTCLVEYNAIRSNLTIKWNNTASDSPGYCFKADSQSGQYMNGWIADHNTFFCQGPGLNGINTTAIRSNNFTNNIFYSINGSYVLSATGYKVNGTFYDGNIYFKASGTTPIFNLRNNDTGNQDTLASALASPYNPADWDLNSFEADPLFNDNLSLSFNSIACNNALDGTDIGAYPCEDLYISFTSETPINNTILNRLKVNVTAEINKSILLNMSLRLNNNVRILRDDDLLIYYNFNNDTSLGENQSLVYDEGFLNVTSNISGTNITSCRWGKCRKIEPEASNIKLNTNIDLNSINNWSFEAYVNFTPENCEPFDVCGAVFNQFISNLRNGTSLAITNGTSGIKRLTLYVANATGSESDINQPINDNQFYHLVLTKSNMTYALYLDGELIVRRIYDTVPVANNRTLELFTYGSSTANYSGAAMYDYVRIYNSTLSDTDVLTNFVLTRVNSGQFMLNLSSILTSEGNLNMSVGVNNVNSEIRTYNLAVSYNLTINYSVINKTHDFIMGIQEKDANFPWVNTTNITDNHKDVATHERIWIHEISYNGRMWRTTPLLADCVSYNYTNLTKSIYTALINNLTPYISFTAHPNCMNNGTNGTTNNDNGLPRSFIEYGNYTRNVIQTYYNDFADDGLLNYTNESGQYLVSFPTNFSNIYWELRNEPNGDIWWGLDANLSKLLNTTIPIIRAAVPTATLCHAGGDNARTTHSEGRVSAFYGNMSSENYPDCFGIHQYDQGKQAELTVSDTGWNTTSFNAFIDGIKEEYFTYPNLIKSQIDVYKNNTIFLNFEYNADSTFTPYPVPMTEDIRGRVWGGSALFWMSLSELQGQNYFQGTKYRTDSVEWFNMWNLTGGEQTPIFYTYKGFNQHFTTGENLYQTISDDGIVEVLATNDSIMIVNKRNVSTEIYLRLTGNTVGLVTEDTGRNVLDFGNGIYGVTVDGYDVSFLTIGLGDPLHHFLKGTTLSLKGINRI